MKIGEENTNLHEEPSLDSLFIEESDENANLDSMFEEDKEEDNLGSLFDESSEELSDLNSILEESTEEDEASYPQVEESLLSIFDNVLNESELNFNTEDNGEETGLDNLFEDERLLSFAEVKEYGEYDYISSINRLQILQRNMLMKVLDIVESANTNTMEALEKLRLMVHDAAPIIYQLAVKISDEGTLANMEEYVDKIMNFKLNRFTEEASDYSVRINNYFSLITKFRGTEDSNDMSYIIENRVRNKVRKVFNDFFITNSKSRQPITDMYMLTRGSANIANSGIPGLCKAIYERFKNDDELVYLDIEGNMFLPEKVMQNPSLRNKYTNTKENFRKVGEWISKFPLNKLEEALYRLVESHDLYTTALFSIDVKDLFSYDEESSARTLIREIIKLSLFNRDSLESRKSKSENLLDSRIQFLYNNIVRLNDEEIEALRRVRRIPSEGDYSNDVYKYGGYNGKEHMYTCGKCGKSHELNGPLISYIKVGFNNIRSLEKRNHLVLTKLSICEDCKSINVVPADVIERIYDTFDISEPPSQVVFTDLNGNVVFNIDGSDYDITSEIDGIEETDIEEVAVDSADNFILNSNDYIESSEEYFKMLDEFRFELNLETKRVNPYTEVKVNDVVVKSVVDEKEGRIYRNFGKVLNFTDLNLMSKLMCKVNSKDYNKMKESAIASLLDYIYPNEGFFIPMDYLAIQSVTNKKVYDKFLNSDRKDEAEYYKYILENISIEDVEKRIYKCLPLLGTTPVKDIHLSEEIRVKFDLSSIKSTLNNISELMIIHELLPSTIDIYKYYSQRNNNLFNLDFYEYIPGYFDKLKDNTLKTILFDISHTENINKYDVLFELRDAVINYDLSRIVYLSERVSKNFQSINKDYLSGVDDMTKGFGSMVQMTELMVNSYKLVNSKTLKFVRDLENIEHEYLSIESIRPLVSNEVFNTLNKLYIDCGNNTPITSEYFNNKYSEEEFELISEFLAKTENMSIKFNSVPNTKTNDFLEFVDDYLNSRGFEMVEEFKLFTEYYNDIIIELSGLASLAGNVNNYGDYLLAVLMNYNIILEECGSNFNRFLSSSINRYKSLKQPSKSPSTAFYYLYNLFENTSVIKDLSDPLEYINYKGNHEFINSLLSETILPDSVYDAISDYRNEDGSYLFNSINELDEVLNLSLGIDIKDIKDIDKDYTGISEILGG